jgi:DNA (cytosine-5)-methyltransferase 1
VPILLDLFAGAGGAALGYYNAGFDVYGVDINPQPHFPWPARFIQADAMEVLETGKVSGLPIEGFDAIHASPPCQSYSRAMKHLTEGYPELLEPVLAHFRKLDIPWVIENVMGAPLPDKPTLDGDEGVLLCGMMFGQQIHRHRLFQSSFPILLPPSPHRCREDVVVMNPHNAGARRKWRELLGPGIPIERTWREEMGVWWMDAHEGRESIPPTFTEHIGHYLKLNLRNRGMIK